MKKKIINNIKSNTYNFKHKDGIYSFYELDQLDWSSEYISEDLYLEDFYYELTYKELKKYFLKNFYQCL